MPQTVRDTAFDTGKAIAIIGMCIGHTHAPQTLVNFIYLFHMPLFFIVSGYFFSLKSLDNPKGYLVRRIKRLYVPMVLIVWAVQIFWISYQQICFGSFDHSLLAPIWRAPLFMYGQPWFLKCLILVTFLAFFFFTIDRKFKKHANFIAATLFIGTYVLGNICIYNNLIGNETVIRVLMVAILFYIGFLWKKNKDIIKVSYIITIICFITFLIISITTEDVLININDEVFANPLTFLIFSIAGTYMVYCFSKLINKNNIAEKVLTYVGRNSLVIYLFNHVCNGVFDKITGGGVHWIPCSLFAIIVPLIIVAIYERLCNFVGGR